MLAKVALLALVAAASIAARRAPSVTAIRPVELHGGNNTLPHFLPGGGTATIVQAWRGNGNAHGYQTWMVLSPSSEGQHPALVTRENPKSHMLEDLIRDEPFDGEQVVEQILFARAKVDGRPASLLISSRLDSTASMVFAARAPASIRIFRLVATDGEPGDTRYEFKLLTTIHTSRQYCNAELAMSQALKLPLRADFSGANRVDGCF